MMKGFQKAERNERCHCGGGVRVGGLLMGKDKLQKMKMNLKET